jgi:hypothetical protein
MTQLTRLEIFSKLPSSALTLIVELPRLKVLYLEIYDRICEPVALPLESEHLTHLTLQGYVTHSVSHVFVFTSNHQRRCYPVGDPSCTFALPQKLILPSKGLPNPLPDSFHGYRVFTPPGGAQPVYVPSHKL